MINKAFSKRVISFFLCIVLMLTTVPLTAISVIASESVTGVVTDKSTLSNWEKMLGSSSDGNRYAGRVWVDRSVYKNGDVITLNNVGGAESSFTVALEDDEQFQVIFSALGSTMSSTEITSSSGPMDVVIILDNSDSMKATSSNVSRMERVINAANGLIDKLLANFDVRLGITSYNSNAQTLLPFGKYTNGVNLSGTRYTSSNGGGLTARDDDGKVLGQTNGYDTATNTQAGYDLAMKMLESASDVKGRTPIVIVLTDGAANQAVDKSFYDISKGTSRQIYYTNNIHPAIALSTLLSTAYRKAVVEDHYGKTPFVYGIGVDLSSSDGSNAIINPSANFNSQNTNANIRNAYADYLDWASGDTITYRNSNVTYTYDHNYPAGTTVTDADVIRHINYVDAYYNATSADLDSTFDLIYNEISSSAFNPITSSTTTAGGTGVDDTPLIYVDFIGQYMEIKEIEAITLFGASYSVIKDEATGKYTVEKATGTNPTTKEAWDTSEDIIINVTEENGIQKLEIRINQEILPIILEKVETETVGNETTSTITEYLYNPLRIFYTVGLDSDILLPNGKIDVTKIQGYEYIDDTTGTATFYGSTFGMKNPADSSGTVLQGDAHVGFRPSPENRYYYHQSNQGIFTTVTDLQTGEKVTIPENNTYGIEWDDSKYGLTWMSYDDYKTARLTDIVYTYVTYDRPTESTTDDPNAAEKVTYLVYTEWQYLKESVSFYDNNTGKYVNMDATNGYVTSDTGVAIPMESVEAVLAQYIADNPDAELYAVLGVGSVRTSYFHNMTVVKDENLTGTAVESYAPEYLHGTSEIEEHNDNDVVVWLGNNSKYTVEIDTGIKLTKAVTEAIGNPDDTYALTVTVPSGVTATPVVEDVNGNDVTAAISTYRNNVLTVNLKAGETVYISGIPGGTTCLIDEIIDGDYYKVSSSTSSIRVPLLSEVLDDTNPLDQYVQATVTNAPNKYGTLHITKEIESTHNVPASVTSTSFDIVVNVGAALAGRAFTVKTGSTETTKTVDNSGNIALTIVANQTIDILGLPEGTRVTVTELTPASHFKAPQYRTRNHTGENADNDNVVIIPADAAATVVILNTYEPLSTSATLNIAGTKNFIAEQGVSLGGGSFTFRVEAWDGANWVAVNGKTVTVPYAAGESGTKNFTINDVLSGISYTKAGTYQYRIVEVKGSVENVTYDRTVYPFTVTVTDNGGQLVAALTSAPNSTLGSTYNVSFTNVFNTATIDIDIIKNVVNRSAQARAFGDVFKFQVVKTDSNWDNNSSENITEISVLANGQARFTAHYSQSGTYYYEISEINENKTGWTYSGAKYRVTVKVIADSIGDLIASIESITKVDSANTNEVYTISTDKIDASVSFENTYKPLSTSVDLDIVVTKDFIAGGHAHDALTFDFAFQKLNQENDTWQTVQIASITYATSEHGVKSVDLEDVLANVTFSEIGTYHYRVVELKGTQDNVTYDRTVYSVIVTVTDNNGQLVAELTERPNVPIGNTLYAYFENTYNTATVDFNIKKLINDNSKLDKTFEFEIIKTDSSWNRISAYPSVYANAIASATFVDTYTSAGEYFYEIYEVDLGETGWSCSTAKYRIKVEVISDSGDLSANIVSIEKVSSTNNNEAFTKNSATEATIVFENIYQPISATVDIDVNGDKTLVVDNPSYTHGGVSFNFAVQEWNGTSWVALSGKTATVSYAAGVSGKKNFTIENVLGGITYNVVGTHQYRVVEVMGDTDNITYDRTVYYFVVNVVDDNGTLKPTVIDGDRNTITEVEASFTNTYNTASIDIDIQKDLINKSGDTAMETEVFTFELVETDSSWNAIGAAEKLYAIVNGQVRFLEIYSEVGTYYYEIKEVNDNKAGWSYSSAKYRVTVEVSADPDGKLLAVISSIEKAGSTNTAEKWAISTDKTEATVNFENTYAPSGISVNLDGKVRKELTGKTLKSGMFEFYVYNNNDRTTRLFKGTNDLNGNVNFVDSEDVLSFDKVGKYEYDIIEAIPAGAVLDTVSGKYVLNGMSYDATIYDLVVEITNNKATGKLEANFYFEDSTTTEVTFYNSYSVKSTEYTIRGTKHLSGRAVRAGEFSFELYLGDTLIETVTNKANGTFSFSTIKYDAAGEYTYTIKEKAGSVPGVTYTGSTKPITVKVTVTDTLGVLGASADVDNAGIVFENTYTASPAKVVFDGTKTFVGKALKENDFTFKLYQTDNSFNINATDSKHIATANNKGEKFDKFSFEQLLDKTGTYFFVVVEDQSEKLDGVVYDETQYRYIVSVSDIGDGQLRATVTNALTGVVIQAAKEQKITLGFTNAAFDEVAEKEVYLEGSTSIHIDGEEVKAGDVLTYFLTYNNFTGKDVVVDIIDVIPNHTEYVDGSASHDGTFVGDHLLWVLNVKKGESVTVTFDVKVKETDAVFANTATMLDGVNTYKTNEVVNHTFENEMSKDVFASSDTAVSINGEKVYEGDELLYKVNFTNTSKNPAKITITDKIPENTTYVDGSADNGGKYEGGKLTWTLDVDGWATVTVAFKVKVNSDIGAKTITNKATATDGTNNYETNVVTNYTVKDEFVKDVALGEKPEVSIDSRKVYAGDILVYTITYKNTANESAAVTITDKIPENTTYVDGSADNGGLYNEGTIIWELSVEAGKTATVSFKVKVNDVGSATIENTADLKESKNTYKTNTVKNYTVQDEVEKNVFDAADPSVSIDGKPVLFGDTLLYAISYKNTSSEKVTITVTDKVPENTTYVDGSANNGGVCENGTITWTLDVEAGQIVTVSFKVTVDNVLKATITNEAVVIEGNNEYITNVVSNPTENVLPPETGDNSNLWMWFALLFISGTAILGNTLKVKRRRQLF